MQIHISWKAIVAGVLFLIACALLVRFGMAVLTPNPTAIESPATALAGEAAATTQTANPASTPEGGAAATATVAATPTTLPPTTAAPTRAPATATAAPATEQPTEAPPTATALPPTATPFQPPTSVPTPVRAQVVITAQGFGQLQGAFSYAFVAQNPNTDVGAQNILFQLAAYDAAGVVLTTDTGTITGIGPGQQIGVAQALTLAPELIVSRIEITLRQGDFVQGGEVGLLPVDQPAFVPGQPPRLTGIVKNPRDQDLVNISVVGVAYQGGAIVGGGTVEVSFIPAQGQSAFSIPVATGGQPDRVEYYARVSAGTNAP